MEDQTRTLTSCLRDPIRSRSTSLGLRIVILTLDVATIIALAVSIGLYYKWITGNSYPTSALRPNTHTDWTDPTVLAAILISFTWTIFITIRPGWTSKALHLGYHVSLEFFCLVWLLACTIPAFMLRESDFKKLGPVSRHRHTGTVTLMDGQRVSWVCKPHLDTLRKLQAATYSVACAVAALHIILFSLACHSVISCQHPTQTTPPPPHIENAPPRNPTQKTTNQEPTTATTRRSESDYAPQPQSHPGIESADCQNPRLPITTPRVRLS